MASKKYIKLVLLVFILLSSVAIYSANVDKDIIAKTDNYKIHLQEVSDYIRVSKMQYDALFGREEWNEISNTDRKKDKLISMIENKKISSILIEAEIGNGKTTLINSLFKDLQTEEIIYLKLPLVKSIDELKRNLFLELQKIFLKNDLDNQFINAFLDNISAFKLGFLEINFGKKENMWNTIKKLQNTLKELDKNIIVVLDDIERENDANKIYESILFLGELSEYFKNTKTTTLLLVQYSYLEDKLKEINKDTLYLEKYYKYKFKLNEPTASEFPDEDYKLLIEEAISTSPNLSIDKNFKDDLRKNSIIAFCIIILVYSVFIYNNPFFFFIPLFTCHFAFLFYVFMCREYKYERISINFKELAFSSSYFKKNFELCYKKIFLVENIKEIEIIEYHKLLLRKILFKDKLEDKPSYVISFTFFESENLNFAYSMEKNEARRVLRRIKSFLEKEKIYS